MLIERSQHIQLSVGIIAHTYVLASKIIIKGCMIMLVLFSPRRILHSSPKSAHYSHNTKLLNVEETKAKIDRKHRTSRFKFETIPVYHNGLPMVIEDGTDYYTYGTK